MKLKDASPVPLVARRTRTTDDLQYIHTGGIRVSQLVMGSPRWRGERLEFVPAAHALRRTEIYFYFDLGATC